MGNFFQDLPGQITPQNEYHADNPFDAQTLQNFKNQINDGQNNFGAVQTQQAQLAQALKAQAAGQGPNPAQYMLHQATDQNIRQNAGMISSQKGINPALAARLAGENAGMMTQQASGQGAVMAAQQQLGAQGQLAGLYNNTANQNLQSIQTAGGLTNQAVLGTNQINAGVAAQNAAANQATMSGIINGGASAAMAYAAHGGKIPHLAQGGMAPMQFMSNDASHSIASQILAQGGAPTYATGMNLKFMPFDKSSSPTGKSNSDVYDQFGQGDTLGVGSLDPNQPSASPSLLGVGEPASGPSSLGNFQFAQTLKAGGTVPGKAQVTGDSYKNDTVPAMLSPGEIVIPRSIANDPEKAKAFIEHIKKQKPKDGAGYGKVLEAHRKLQESMQLLKECMGGKV